MRIALVVVLMAAAAAAGFLVGTRVGVTSFVQADAKYKASIAAFQLRQIEQQRLEDLKTAKEIELNMHLADHGRYMDSNLKWLWPGLQAEDDKAIASAVQYRTSHPFVEVDFSKAESWKESVDINSPFAQGVIAGQKENEAQLKKVVEAYRP